MSKSNNPLVGVNAVVIRRFRCEGCGIVFNENEIEQFGDGYCHTVAIETSKGEIEPSPCGPVIEITNEGV